MLVQVGVNGHYLSFIVCIGKNSSRLNCLSSKVNDLSVLRATFGYGVFRPTRAAGGGEGAFGRFSISVEGQRVIGGGYVLVSLRGMTDDGTRKYVCGAELS